MRMLDKTSYTPLYIQIKEYIVNRIRAKEYQAGDRLPTERELMEKMQVGRATVRAALSELEHEGLVEKRHGVGTFVKEPEQEMGFEPLISLSYALDKLGIRCINRVVADETVPVQGGLLAEHWELGREVHRLKRLRFGEKIPVAVEDNYFTPALYARISQSARGEQSIAHAILAQTDLIVSKIDYSIVRRQPKEQEQSELRILPEQRVLEMTRWLYFEGEETPASFVQFVMPERFMDYPFAAMKKES